MSRISRRQFLASTAVAACGPMILSSPARGFAAASERIRLGFIGIGIQSRGHLKRFVGTSDTQVIAVCDVVTERREDSKRIVEEGYAKQKDVGSYKGCAAYVDFRELLARDDIDAVVIGTPDHWHAIPAVMACRAGKDVYCEKPLSLTISEGRAMVDAARKHDRVFQTGSQQRSEFGGLFRRAVEIIRNGHLGEIKTVRVGVGGPAVTCDLPTEECPSGTDWNFWNGPSPERGYNQILCPKGIHNHFPAFRNYREYAGGGMADMGAHHFDIAQWALGMDNSGPVKIEPPDDKATTGLKFTYANGIVMSHGGPSGCTFEGTKGTLYVDRGKIESNPANILEATIGPDEFHVEKADNHHRNWIDAIRSRKKPICDVEIGHRSATVCELGQIGYDLRRPLNWDPVKERFVNDDDANKLLSRPMRDPWKL
ncbi:MAG: gfo/Idh/MocA family oxidoreductase [Planctomycetota bacterium]|nr:MAG: gfo/Idh/MocA family oxidoreductase [Planctomycetota bacterium]GDY09918.1 oxidoreductase [Planctomycetia bacterium]